MTAYKYLPPGTSPGFKFITDESGVASGRVEFYASIFGSVDLVGDIVTQGAFAKSLETWRASGDPIPVVFSHDWGDANAIIGYADPNECEEDAKGLLIRANLDILTNPYASQVFNLMKRRIVREASFAYDVVDEKAVKSGPNRGANALNTLNILEVGPCLKGAHPDSGDPVVKSLMAELGIAPKDILEGSIEERQAELNWLVSKTYGTNTANNTAWTAVEGTYPDHVIYCQYNGDGNGLKYYLVPYTVTTTDSNTTGTITLGERKEVRIESTDEKAFAWTDADGEGHIPLDTEGQVRAAINLASNNWTFRGNHMKPAPPADEQAGVISRIRAAANKFGIETDLGKSDEEIETKTDLTDATSETGSGPATVQGQAPGNQLGGVVVPDYEDDEDKQIVEPPTRKPVLGGKAGARNSRSDQTSLQNAHDALVAAGAVCSPDEPDVETKEPADTDEDDVAKFTKRAEFFREIGDLEGELKMLDLAREARKYSPDQERDDHGRFGHDLTVTEHRNESSTAPESGQLPLGQELNQTGAMEAIRESVANGGTDPNNPMGVVYPKSLFGKDTDMNDETKAALEKLVEASASFVKAVSTDTSDTDVPKGDGQKSGNDSGDAGTPADDEKAIDDAEPDGDEDCPTCDGSGEVDGHECPDCGGTGKVSAQTKDLDPGDGDDVDTDGDQVSPAEPNEPPEPFSAQKSASADEKSQDGGDKDDEPDEAKSEGRTIDEIRESAKADLADISRFLSE